MSSDVDSVAIGRTEADQTTTSETEPGRSRSILLAGVGIALLFTVGHGFAHVSIPVPTPGVHAGFVGIFLFGLPIAAAGLAARNRVRTAAVIALVTGLGALAFEGLAHFVIANPDHVASVETSQTLFGGTAGLSLVGDAVLVVVGAWVLRRQSHGSSSTAVNSSTR